MTFTTISKLRLGGSLVAAIALIAAFQCRLHGDEIEKTQDKASEHDKLIAELTTAIESDPNNADNYWRRAEARCYKAYVLDEAGARAEYAAGLADCNRAIELDPQNARSFYMRGKCRNVDFGPAIDDFTEAIRLEPKYADAYSARAETVLENAKFVALFNGAAAAGRQYNAALADYTAVIELDWNRAASFYNRGIVWEIKEDYRQAIVDFSEAIRLEPKNLLFYRGRARVWISHAVKERSLSAFDEAIADLTSAIGLSPVDADLWLRRGDAWADKGLWNDEPTNEYENAIADYTHAIQLQPKHWMAYERRADASKQKREFDKAIADLDVLIDAQPEQGRFYLFRGDMWRDTRQKDKALADYDRAIDLSPQLAEAYLHRGQIFATEAMMPAMAARFFGEPAGEAFPYEDKALADFTDAIRLAPQNAEAYMSRAGVWHDKRDFDRAIDDYSQGLRLKPDYPGGRLARARTYKKQGDYDAALADIETAIERDAMLRSPVLLQAAKMLRADIWIDKKEYERAVAYFTEVEAYDKRREAWRAMGEFQKVIGELSDEVTKHPDNAVKLEELARLLATCPKSECRNGPRAVELARKACELKQWRSPDMLTTLASAYAETNNFAEAANWQSQAVMLAEKSRFRKYLADYRSRLAAYERNEVYRNND